MLAIELAEVLLESETELIINPVQGAGKKPPKNRNANIKEPISSISLTNGIGRVNSTAIKLTPIKTF